MNHRLVYQYSNYIIEKNKIKTFFLHRNLVNFVITQYYNINICANET